MAEVVGGAILTAVIQVLVESLASPEVANFFQNKLFVSKLSRKLEVKLLSANKLLNDAEDKQVKDEHIMKWVDELNEVLNEADNVIDEINTKALCRKVEGEALRKKIIKLLTSFNPFKRGIKNKLEEIIESLVLCLDEAENLGLKAGVPSKRLSRSPAPLIEDPSDVYGRGGDKKAILDLLFSENSGQDKISVIPIVGMGGVGKTTLARLVYNDSRVEDCFEHRAWVTVSDDFDVLKLAKLVLEGLSGKKCEVTELGKVGEELKKFLGGKKFFLVLDDVWNENYTLWNSLKSYFEVGADGSKIIMTTRSEQIGSKMGSVSSHSLTPMEDDDCWKLFQKHAFRSVEDCTKQLETIGIEIVKKCKGLPIAVVSLAGLLRSVSDPKEWEKVRNSDVLEQERKGDDEILPSLWFSYSYLPSNVKRCFAYCSIFPKDYEFEKEKIMLLWMAEGLVQGENMEKVGEEYFKTLVSRSLLQRSAEDESSFVMHDLVHDLATFVSGKGFCLRLGKGDGLERLSSKTRHLLCYSYLDDPKGLSRANNLRTFISNSKMSARVSQEFPKKFGCLRVLCLSYIGKLPDSIGKLEHLRYLDLSRTEIKELPGTVCSLYNLQTLLLRGCYNLTHLPAKMEKLINLRHLDISETRSLKEIPQSVYKLKALQTITKFKVGSGSRISELIKFPHLRGCLEVFGIENIVDVKDAAGFEGKSLVTELVLGWGTESNDAAKDRAILDALQPHPNLKNLSIYGYGGIEFSYWVASFSNITEVLLRDCKYCFQLPPFGQLPSLQKLQVWGLHSVETIGSEFYGSSGAAPFPCLKILEIGGMDKLQSWSIEAEGAFPCLEELTIESCKHCCQLPPFGQLPCLKKLYVKGLDSVETIVSEFYGSSGATPFPCLKILQIINMDKLQSWSFEAEGAFPCLEELTLYGCPMLKTIHCLSSLKKLSIYNCPTLEFSGLPLPSSLKKLYICNCAMFFAQHMQWGLKALTELEIRKCNIPDSFPEEGLLPTTLAYLQIWDIPNLKSLNGKAFQHLTSLKTLNIHDCPELQSLPEEGLPASLQRLIVSGCPILEARLKRETGEDWHKISHIPTIRVNGEQV